MRKNKERRIDPFSESSLTILISVITLFLQMISFATTWNGSRIYLEGVFPCASLLFAIAIQSTAYFFSNSLRGRVSVLKLAALLTVLCCSTYYSYIGIYNSVNSPVSFLQENYVRIESELTQIYDAEMEVNIAAAKESVNNAASLVIARYTALLEEQKNIEECREQLSEIQDSYASGMRAPRLSDYENYEDYVAAYSAYITGISTGSNTENEAFRKRILAAHGYSSMNELNEAETDNASSLKVLNAAFGVNRTAGEEALIARVSDISVRLSAAIDNAALGQEFDGAGSTELNGLFQAAEVCGYRGAPVSDIINVIKNTVEASKDPLMTGYRDLVADLPEGRVTSANTMEL